MMMMLKGLKFTIEGAALKFWKRFAVKVCQEFRGLFTKLKSKSIDFDFVFRVHWLGFMPVRLGKFIISGVLFTFCYLFGFLDFSRLSNFINNEKLSIDAW